MLVFANVLLQPVTQVTASGYAAALSQKALGVTRKDSAPSMSWPLRAGARAINAPKMVPDMPASTSFAWCLFQPVCGMPRTTVLKNRRARPSGTAGAPGGGCGKRQVSGKWPRQRDLPERKRNVSGKFQRLQIITLEMRVAHRGLSIVEIHASVAEGDQIGLPQIAEHAVNMYRGQPQGIREVVLS